MGLRNEKRSAHVWRSLFTVLEKVCVFDADGAVVPSVDAHPSAIPSGKVLSDGAVDDLQRLWSGLSSGCDADGSASRINSPVIAV